MKAMLIDINLCNGCHNCQIACKDEHVGNDWTPIAKPQPDIGQFWMKITDVVQGSVPKVRVRYMLDICQHCDNAPCISACKTKAIHKRDDGIVIINPQKCTGGRECLEACPFDVIYFNSDMNIAQKCTFCAHLLDDGWQVPRCVDACPTDALRFGEREDLKEYLDGAELLHPEYNSKPRVYYKGLLNKYFVAGAVYDPEDDECLEDCMVTLTGTGDIKKSTNTDDFGDFWFERLEPGMYTLLVEKEGYLPRRFENIDATKDVNVGDIELIKKA
ncbi:MAG: carboxypeptidase regulatory-like domain-containing protein [Desulfobacteraceae bacterium]|jgi:Fe-S-cluster-containing dehydrogenase component